MKKTHYIVNATSPIGLEIAKALLESDSECQVVAQANGALKALAPLAMGHKGRVTSYQADLSDSDACALFIKDAMRYSGAPSSLIYIQEPLSTAAAESGFTAAMQEMAGSVYEMLLAFCPEMPDGQVIFAAGSQAQNAATLNAMGMAAQRALYEAYSNNTNSLRCYWLENASAADILSILREA